MAKHSAVLSIAFEPSLRCNESIQVNDQLVLLLRRKKTNCLGLAVISSALNLIIEQLHTLDTDISRFDLPKEPDAVPPMTSYGIPDPHQADENSVFPSGPEAAAYSSELFEFPTNDFIDPDDVNMMDSVDFESIFETMSSLEPLSVRVAALENPENENL